MEIISDFFNLNLWIEYSNNSSWGFLGAIVMLVLPPLAYILAIIQVVLFLIIDPRDLGL